MERSMLDSTWRRRLLAAVACNVVWELSVQNATAGSYPWGLSHFGIAFGVSTLALTPVFYHALWTELRNVADAPGDWTPNRRLWVGVSAVGSLVGLIVWWNPYLYYPALVYYVQRYRKHSVGTAPEPTG